MISVGLATTSLLTGCATASDGDVCAQLAFSDSEPSARYETVAPRDLGRGFIAFDTSSNIVTTPDDIRLQESTTIVDCRTGDDVTLTRASRAGGVETLQDYRADVAQLLNARQSVPADKVIETVKAQAQTRDVPNSSSDLDREECGCALFYPELRGTKTPFEGLL